VEYREDENIHSTRKGIIMNRRWMAICIGVLTAGSMMIACNNSSPTNPPPTPPSDTPPAPSGVTVLFAEGFGDTLGAWQPDYLIKYGDPTYPRMRITTAAAHTGTHSVTSDTSWSALEYVIPNQLYTGTVGVQFYIMATAKGEANFSVQYGQNAGSSGGLGHAWGLGFGHNDSLVAYLYDYMSGTQYQDSSLFPMQLNHWYKCVVEANFNDSTFTYYVDDQKVRTATVPAQDWYGLDRLIVYRGTNPYDEAQGLDHQSGPKPYYADDIVLYKK
jgi:hypothetical protein